MAPQEPPKTKQQLPQEDSEYHLTPGQRYEGFDVLRRIGRGGFGEVYLVKDADGKRGALKVFVPADKNDKKSAHRFLMEAQILKRMRPHTHLVRCDGHGQASDEKRSLWILLEFLPGNTLRRELEISEAGRMSLERALRLGIQVAMALSHCHAHGLVHRDVKPENVMITPGDLAKLLDFGIAKAQGVHLRTTRNVQLGTGLYMAPDRLVHQGDDANPLWDMYSLGVMMWELCTGHHPFHSRPGEALTDAEVIHKHMSYRIPSLAEETGYPEDVCAPIMRACAGDPRARFANMEELIVALEAVLLRWRDMSTEKVNVLGRGVPDETRARIVQATTEPSIAFSVASSVEPAKEIAQPAPRWLRTEPIAVVPAPDAAPSAKQAPAPAAHRPPLAQSTMPISPAAFAPAAPPTFGLPGGTARLAVPMERSEPPAPAPQAPRPAVWDRRPPPEQKASPPPVIAPVPSAHVLHELGRPPRTPAEEAIVEDLDPEEQAFRILFLRYIDTLPKHSMIDGEATARAVWDYIDEQAQLADAEAESESLEPAAPLSRSLRGVPGWVLVVLGVMLGAAATAAMMWWLLRR
ncbi:MAG: serine/threonine-protein kinase [Polyangiaceae bacterium]